MKTITTMAPASIGNFSVGFDVLGVAVEPVDGSVLGDRVTLTPAEGTEHSVAVSGPFSSWLPEHVEENVVWHCLLQFSKQLPGAMHLQLEKNLPVASGLGSSAASIVAAAAACNAAAQKPLNRDRLLQLCADLEGRISGSVHLDNIAPSLFGGAVLCNEGSYSDLAKLVFPEQWQFVLAYSGQRVPTEDMRKILPAKFSKDLLTLQSRELTQFIRALAVGDHRGAAEHIVDHLAEPLRAPLLEGYSDAREQCLALGARAVGISGSGPTLFAVCDSDTVAASLCHWLENNYRAADHAFVKLCRLQTTGVRVSISEQ